MSAIARTGCSRNTGCLPSSLRLLPLAPQVAFHDLRGFLLRFGPLGALLRFPLAGLCLPRWRGAVLIWTRANAAVS
jgi:hypothetical protein